MNIIHQYYNEIVLAFANYDTNIQEGIIFIYVPEDGKPFEIVCEKIDAQIQRIAGTLEPRDEQVRIQVKKGQQSKEIVLAAEDIQ